MPEVPAPWGPVEPVGPVGPVAPPPHNTQEPAFLIYILSTSVAKYVAPLAAEDNTPDFSLSVPTNLSPAYLLTDILDNYTILSISLMTLSALIDLLHSNFLFLGHHSQSDLSNK